MPQDELALTFSADAETVEFIHKLLKDSEAVEAISEPRDEESVTDALNSPFSTAEITPIVQMLTIYFKGGAEAFGALTAVLTFARELKKTINVFDPPTATKLGSLTPATSSDELKLLVTR